jgi:hypothetical protein
MFDDMLPPVAHRFSWHSRATRRRGRPFPWPVTHSGANGATATQEPQALDESGLSVTGVKVGVISESFNDLGRAAAAERTALPMYKY